MKNRIFLTGLLVLAMVGLCWGQGDVTPSRVFAPYLKLGRTTPGSVTDTLTNPAGVLNYNGTPITMGGGTGVQLQSSTPGTAQTGHGNISGTFIAGAFSGPLTGNVTGNVSGNAGTVTNGVYTKW